MSDDRPIRLGVSTCLLGEQVRWDGGHSRNRYVTDVLGRWVEWVPVCPEVEYGLPVPRPTLRLEGDVDAPRLVMPSTGQDHTDGMKRWARARLDDLEREDLCGYVFKSKSPSSGMERVRVYGASGRAQKKGSGIFARAFMDRFPWLPVEEEGRLNDPGLRESFIERIFALRRWKDAASRGRTRGGIVEFHTRSKLQILAHSRRHLTALGRLVASAKDHPPRRLWDRYMLLFMEALAVRATAKKHTDVLMHAMGFLKKFLTTDEKKELLEVIGSYRRGQLPLIVPVTLLAHHVRKHGSPWLADQAYLDPHPAELGLRNHV